MPNFISLCFCWSCSVACYFVYPSNLKVVRAIAVLIAFLVGCLNIPFIIKWLTV